VPINPPNYNKKKSGLKGRKTPVSSGGGGGGGGGGRGPSPCKEIFPSPSPV